MAGCKTNIVAHSKYQFYKETLQKIADIKYASAVLQWDQETYLPAKGADIRGQQIATLSELAHKEFANDKVKGIIEDVLSSSGLTDSEKRNAELSYEDYRRAIKLSPAFVRKSSEAINRSFHAWIAARKANSFREFLPQLEEVINIKQEEAQLLGYEHHPYDALMNDYDKGLTVKTVDNLFTSLKTGISELLNFIAGKPQPDDSFLKKHVAKNAQWEYGMQLLKKLHFDFKAGRQDLSEHPFTTNFNRNDVRLTTSIDENDMANMIWSCIHECGHGLYEQGLPEEHYGLPLGEYCSLSIHESQSRIWENCIGRSHSFWKNELFTLNEFTGIDVDSREFYKAINRVQPSLIRTDADELSYHFHVMIRYEIEKNLIDGSLNARDIPIAWNDMYKKYLDIAVPDDKRGCLQDVHWSHGSFGYFATYSIGSLYAAQFYQSIKKQVPTLEAEFESGNTAPVFNWLKQHIYPYGRYYSSEELCKKATGEPLNSAHFMDYATEKFKEIYIS